MSESPDDGNVIVIDIEATNRCNAKCNFCPRDKTPHEGLMTPETFQQALARVDEFAPFARAELDLGIQVSICGLGEPLLNKHTPSYIEQVRARGYSCVMSSNASLLDETRARRVLDAGVQRILINVGDVDDSYEEVYQLPFEKTRDNIVAFQEMAGDACDVVIILVDYKDDTAHIEAMKDFWRAQGIHKFRSYSIINRGGSLEIDHMQFQTFPELQLAKDIFAGMNGTPVCAAPFIYMFVGYDGQYYLCCSDWEKRAPLGTVFDETFLSVIKEKVRNVVERTPVCQTCNCDPLNQLTEQLRAETLGQSTADETKALIAQIEGNLVPVGDLIAKLEAGAAAEGHRSASRRLIPVSIS
jgi:MoaA/NifB/PqqE/SkfB family radical SAM enzyme